MQRGTCPFGTKAANAEAAGASGVVIFNRGSAGSTESFAGTLGVPVGIPAVGTSFASGGARAGVIADLVRICRICPISIQKAQYVVVSNHDIGPAGSDKREDKP